MNHLRDINNLTNRNTEAGKAARLAKLLEDVKTDYVFLEDVLNFLKDTRDFSPQAMNESVQEIIDDLEATRRGITGILKEEPVHIRNKRAKYRTNPHATRTTLNARRNLANDARNDAFDTYLTDRNTEIDELNTESVALPVFSNGTLRSWKQRRANRKTRNKRLNTNKKTFSDRHAQRQNNFNNRSGFTANEFH